MACGLAPLIQLEHLPCTRVRDRLRPVWHACRHAHRRQHRQFGVHVQYRKRRLHTMVMLRQFLFLHILNRRSRFRLLRTRLPLPQTQCSSPHLRRLLAAGCLLQLLLKFPQSRRLGGHLPGRRWSWPLRLPEMASQQLRWHQRARLRREQSRPRAWLQSLRHQRSVALPLRRRAGAR